MRVLRKTEIVQLRQVEHVNAERYILSRVHHPFVVDPNLTTTPTLTRRSSVLWVNRNRGRGLWMSRNLLGYCLRLLRVRIRQARRGLRVESSIGRLGLVL